MTTVAIKESEIIFRNLGFTEEITSCDCCGRINLKGTYAIENIETGVIMYYGCVCAARRMNWSKKEFVLRFKLEEKEQSEKARQEYRNSVEMLAYNHWINMLPDTATDEGWALRINLLKTEGVKYKNALEAKKIELKDKYPLVKYIY